MGRTYTNGQDYFCERHTPESGHLSAIECDSVIICAECGEILDSCLTEDGAKLNTIALRDFALCSDYEFYSKRKSGYYENMATYLYWSDVIEYHPSIRANNLFELRENLWKYDTPLSTIITPEWHQNPDVQRVYNIIQRVKGKRILGADTMRKYVRIIETCVPTTEIGHKFFNHLVKMWADFLPHVHHHSSVWNTFANLFKILENLKEIENG